MKLPNGFYKGSPISFMPGWEGKLFDASTKTGVNVWRSIRLKFDRCKFSYQPHILKFKMEERKDRIWIIYPFLPVHDEIVETETGYSGEIFVFGKKVGEFTLTK